MKNDFGIHDQPITLMGISFFAGMFWILFTFVGFPKTWAFLLQWQLAVGMIFAAIIIRGNVAILSKRVWQKKKGLVALKWLVAMLALIILVATILFLKKTEPDHLNSWGNVLRSSAPIIAFIVALYVPMFQMLENKINNATFIENATNSIIVFLQLRLKQLGNIEETLLECHQQGTKSPDCIDVGNYNKMINTCLKMFAETEIPAIIDQWGSDFAKLNLNTIHAVHIYEPQYLEFLRIFKTQCEKEELTPQQLAETVFLIRVVIACCISQIVLNEKSRTYLWNNVLGNDSLFSYTDHREDVAKVIDSLDIDIKYFMNSGH